jgi:hypothetical protein
MQPYFLPYLGYFQLIHSADTFVIYDDVNYIKGGWINRNRILGRQADSELITLEVLGASPNKLINEVEVGRNRQKLLKTIAQRYTRAPQFDAIYPLVSQILAVDESNLTRFLFLQLQLICRYLDIEPTWKLSSDITEDSNFKGQDRVIAICQALGASTYINASGGKSLYSHAAFDEQQLELSFIESKAIEYQQFSDDFVPFLSIVDVLMFNDLEACKSLLREYSLVD